MVTSRWKSVHQHLREIQIQMTKRCHLQPRERHISRAREAAGIGRDAVNRTLIYCGDAVWLTSWRKTMESSQETKKRSPRGAKDSTSWHLFSEHKEMNQTGKCTFSSLWCIFYVCCSSVDEHQLFSLIHGLGSSRTWEGRDGAMINSWPWMVETRIQRWSNGQWRRSREEPDNLLRALLEGLGYSGDQEVRWLCTSRCQESALMWAPDPNCK